MSVARPLAGMLAGFALTATLMSGCASLPARHLVDVAPVDAPAPTTPVDLGVRASTPLPPCEGDRVPVVGNSPLDCDVTPPQALDVWWPGSDGIEQAHFQDECDHMGGRLEWALDQFVCRGVDY